MNYINLIRSYTRYLTYAVMHSFFSGYGQTFLVALFLPEIAKTLGFDFTRIGTFYSAATLCATALLPFAGGWIDRVRLTTYSRWVGTALIGSLLLLGLGKHIALIFLGLVILRLTGQSLMTHISATAMARYFDHLRGKALGLSSLGHPLGEGIMPIFTVQLITAFGWEKSFLILAGVMAAVFYPGLTILVKKDDPFLKPGHSHQKQDKPLEGLSRRDVFTTPFFYFVIPLGVLPPFLATGLFFAQTAVADYKGWSIEWLATCFIGFAIFRIFGSFLVGPIIDRYTARRVYPFHLIPMAFGFIALAMGHHMVFGLIYMSLFGLAIGFEFNIKSALWAEVYGTRHLGAIRSIIMPIPIFTTAISPILFGWFIDNGVSFDLVLGISVALILATSILSAFAPPIHQKTR